MNIRMRNSRFRLRSLCRHVGMFQPTPSQLQGPAFFAAGSSQFKFAPDCRPAPASASSTAEPLHLVEESSDIIPVFSPEE